MSLHKQNPITLIDWRKFTEHALSEAGFSDVALETKWLLEGAINKKITLNPSYVPTPEEAQHINEWITRRIKGEPLSRIKGMREFWSLPFHINEYTLDPRPETELIIEGVLKWVKPEAKYHILDLGTGSGCILITLLHELKQATGVGVDISPEALEVAKSNADLNGVSDRVNFIQGNWGEGIEQQFDIIVSNPPYIPLSDKPTLDKAVRDFDPASALWGGENGLELYPHIIKDAKRLLKPGGLLVLEIGQGQHTAVETMLLNSRFTLAFVLKDLAGIERTIGALPEC